MEQIQDIVFLGGGTAFLEIKELIDDINENKPTYKVIAILDDNPDLHGTFIGGFRIEGPLSKAADYPDAKFVFGIGSMKTRAIRLEIIHRLGIQIERFVTLIHPHTKIYKSAQIGHGCIIHYGSIVGANVVLGNFNIITFNSVIGENVQTGEGTMIANGVVILGGTKIGSRVFIGTGSRIANSMSIGDDSFIGMGSVIIKNIAPNLKVFGNPPRTIP